MTQDNLDPNTSDTQPSPPAGSRNRLVLIAVLAVVVVVTVLLVRQNMEPPPQQAEPQAQASGQASRQQNAEQLLEERMDQISHVEDILAQDSSNFEAWAALGNLYYDANMAEKAVEHYQKALELRPNDLHVQTDMATMMRSQGDSEGAVKLLDKVVSQDSNFTQAWFNLGVIHTFDLKNNSEAVHAWTRYLALDPNSPHAEAITKELERLKAEM